MSRNASGTYSLPAGNPVVSGTTISTTTHNNTMGDIATELSDSLSRSGKGGMTAPLRTADGTVAAPAHSFTNETGTGVYRKGAHNPAIAVNGVEQQEWTDTGSRVSGAFEATGNATVGGTLGVTGAATLASAGVTGNATVGGTLGVTGLSTLATASVTGNATVGGTLGVTGKATSAATVAGDGATTLTTKGYVDGSAASLTAQTGWTISSSLARTAGKMCWVSIVATAGVGAAWTDIVDLPAGYEPAASVYAMGTITDSSASLTYAAEFLIATTGHVWVQAYDNGTSMVAPFAIGTGDIAHVSFMLIAP